MTTNFEQATQIAHRGGYKIEDALELLNSGMSQEEVEKVLERKKKKSEKKESRRLDKEFGELIWSQITSPWVARRDKRRKWRKQCVDRWGDLAYQIKREAFRTHVNWYVCAPIMVFILTFDLGIVPLMYGLLAFAALHLMRMALFFSGSNPNEYIQRLWMTRKVFRWWANRTGKRLFVQESGETISEERLISIVGKKKAAKLIKKREETQAKCAEMKRRLEEIKERQMDMARQYCSNESEAERLYRAAHPKQIWMTIVLLALCATGAWLIGMTLFGVMPMAIVVVLIFAWFAVAIQITYVIAYLIAHFYGYERSLKRVVKKQAISRVMNDKKESSKAEQENCSG